MSPGEEAPQVPIRAHVRFVQSPTDEVGKAEADKALGWAYQSIGEKKKAVEFYRPALGLRLKVNRTVVSDELTVEITQLREAIKKLQE